MPRPLDIINPKKDLDKIEEKDFEQSSDKRSDDQGSFEIEESKDGGTFYLILGIIAIVVATVFAIYILYRDDNSNKEKNSIAVSSPEASAESTQQPEGITEEANVATPIAEPTVTAEASYSGMSVRVANGNNRTGEAARVKRILEDTGFSITSVGNATRAYENTIIFYKTGKQNLAEALKKALAGEYSATVKNSDSTVGNYDAVIALGKN